MVALKDAEISSGPQLWARSDHPDGNCRAPGLGSLAVFTVLFNEALGD
jgi:hypothetical protein